MPDCAGCVASPPKQDAAGASRSGTALLCANARTGAATTSLNATHLQKQAALAAYRAKASQQPASRLPLDPDGDAPVPHQVLFPHQHYLQLWHKSSSRRPPVGLTNPGNNCYANACLQCLLMNKPLRAYLDQGLHTSSCNKPHRNEWCLLCELQVRMLFQSMSEMTDPAVVLS